MIDIVRFCPDDLPALLACPYWREVGEHIRPDWAAAVLAAPAAVVFGVRGNGHIRAFIAGEMGIGGEAEMRVVWVEETLRGCGVGRRMLDMLESEFMAMGAVSIVTYSDHHVDDLLSAKGYTSRGMFRKMVKEIC